MFSSPGNAKFPKFVTRYPHHQSFLVDSMSCDLGGGTGSLCQPPLESNHALVGQVEPEQKTKLSPSNPYVGFKCMVAPINQNVQTKDKNVGHPPRGGDVHQLLGRINACSPLAPGLHDCLRFLLEQQQIGDQEILLAIKNMGNVSRYDRAFKKLYVILKEKHGEPLKARIVEVATAILLLSEISMSDARNAYSAVCLLPGFEHVKFSPILKNFKRAWNHSTQKYAISGTPNPSFKSCNLPHPWT
jgi:hypothetical protein